MKLIGKMLFFLQKHIQNYLTMYSLKSLGILIIKELEKYLFLKNTDKLR